MIHALTRCGVWAGALAVTGLSLVAGGCGPDIQSETFRSSGITEGAQAPGWVENSPMLWARQTTEVNGQNVSRVQDAQQRHFVVGRAVGHNVLDERAAHQQAIDDAIRQLARQVQSRTQDHRQRVRSSKGPEFFPGGSYSAKTKQEVTANTDALTRFAEEHDVYWERWEVRNGEDPGSGAGLTRWKCWVLMSVSEAELEMLAKQNAEWHQRRAAAPAKVYQVTNE
jgi:hypothetical protein